MQKPFLLKPSCVLLPILSLAFFFASCGRGEHYPFTLLQADSLMYERPDSSLKLLEAFATDSLNVVSKSVRMYYTLLRTTADDRNYITHTSDSAMRIVVDYYQKHGPADKLARSYYILGRVYDDMHNYPTALEYYHKTIDTATPLKNHRLLGLTYSQIGTLYVYQGLYEESAEAYKEAYNYANRVVGKRDLPYYLRDLGRAYTSLNNVDSALFYYEKAFSLGSLEFKRKAVLNELASIYLQIEDYKNVLRVLSYDRTAYASWASYYEKLEEKDSAKLYYELSLERDYIYSKEIACRKLSMYAHLAGDEHFELAYLKLANLYKDSIRMTEKPMEVKRKDNQHKLLKLENKYRKEIVEERIVILCIMSFFIIVPIIIFVFRKKNRKKDELDSIRQYPLCKSIIDNAQKNSFTFSESEWEPFISEMNKFHRGFVSRIRNLSPKMTVYDIVVCCLIRLGISNKDLSRMLSRSPNGISSHRRRLYEKLCGKCGTAKMFDEFILVAP